MPRKPRKPKPPLTKHEDDIRRGIRKGPLPKPTRVHRSKKTDFLDRIYESLRRLELDE